MAAVRPPVPMPVGSARWIQDENDQVNQFGSQEVEDFTFAARNEVEWLNEHMAEILSKNTLNVTELLKTPGKLRGKTPRTAKKRNLNEIREPLTDIFSATSQPKSTFTPKASPSKPAATFQVAEDPVAPTSYKKAAKTNTDSGYHGHPEDDIENEELPEAPQSSAETNQTVEIHPDSPPQEQATLKIHSEGRSTAERSFHSVREEITKDITTNGNPQQDTAPSEETESLEMPAEDAYKEAEPAIPNNALMDAESMGIVDRDLDEDLVVDESRSPSQGSSPARLLVRKSSLTFAALPAREPLTTKKSIGIRVSRTSHLEQNKANLSRGSFLGRFTGNMSLGGSKQPNVDLNNEGDDDMDIDMDKTETAREESDTDSKITKLHNKSSTQRLHDKINMLGKSQPARSTKSIPAAVVQATPTYPELPNPEPQTQHLQQIAGLASKTLALQSDNEDDDDWIQPPRPQTDTLNRPHLPKSISTDVMEDTRNKSTIGVGEFLPPSSDEQMTTKASPMRHTTAHNPHVDEGRYSEADSEGHPTPVAERITRAAAGMANVMNSSTTPVGSPASKRYVDGPLSASKSKLQSIMKTARGLFSSSAGVSAQAKMATLSPPSMRGLKEGQGPSINAEPESGIVRQETVRVPPPDPVGRRTRSSVEKGEKRKESEAEEREKAEEKKQVQTKGPLAEVAQQHARPTRQSPRRTQAQEAPVKQTDTGADGTVAGLMGPPPSHPQGHQSQLQKPKDGRRPMKPAKETASKPKPQPVSIRVGTLSTQGIRMNNAALSSGLQDSLPPSHAKQTLVTKKPSNASVHTSASNSSLKSSVNSGSAKPKALIAAEKKKEQDEKEAQRKLDQKREIERRRAAQQEEARRQEQQQRQEAERQRERERAAAAEDPKILAKKQAIEKRRMEMKKDQQRAPQRPLTDQPSISAQSQVPPTSRQELGGPRPPSRLQNVPDHSRNINNQPTHNPANPPIKRVFDPDADEETFKSSRLQGGPSYQPNDAKRRKTEEEEVQEVVRPTMAPPKRQSNMRQGVPKTSIFSNHPTIPSAPLHNHNAPSLSRPPHMNAMSRPGHHPDIGKYQNGKIPFADNPNPPHPSQPYKTPLPSRLVPPAKSSPQYVNGENIHLDDIPTESEDDSDSDSGSKPKPANIPDWANSPQLRQLLMTQDENMDADAVFGPVQSPHMEEMFRERQHRFRSRTSSANWAGADRLTEEEIRRDVEARQKLRRQGEWTIGL